MFTSHCLAPSASPVDTAGRPAKVKAGLVSVIIRTYNRGNRIGRAINSALAQVYQPKEIIVVDDGSTDDTREVVSNYPEVQYVYQDNQGVTAARLTGLGHAKGEFLAYLDSDDEWAPTYLETCLESIVRHKAIVCVSNYHCVVEFKGGTRRPSNIDRSPLYKELRERNPDAAEIPLTAAQLRALAIERGVGPSSCVVLRRSHVSAKHTDRLAWDDMLMMLETVFDHPGPGVYHPRCLLTKYNYHDSIAEGPDDIVKFMAQRASIYGTFLNHFGKRMTRAERDVWAVPLAQLAFDMGYSYAIAGALGEAMRHYFMVWRCRPSLKVLLAMAKAPLVAARCQRDEARILRLQSLEAGRHG